MGELKISAKGGRYKRGRGWICKRGGAGLPSAVGVVVPVMIPSGGPIPGLWYMLPLHAVVVVTVVMAAPVLAILDTPAETA